MKYGSLFFLPSIGIDIQTEQSNPIKKVNVIMSANNATNSPVSASGQLEEHSQGGRALAIDESSTERTPHVRSWEHFACPLDKPLATGLTAKRSSQSAEMAGKHKTLPSSAFGALFAEIVCYFWERADHLSDLSEELTKLGHGIGMRYIELIMARASPGVREPHVEKMLQFISSTVWKHLFGKQGDGLEKSTEHDNSYMIYDNAPLTNRYISVPKDFGSFNCAVFIGGILQGMLEQSNFVSSRAVPEVVIPLHIPPCLSRVAAMQS
eukprot:gb/GECG01016617.1/.p1 GENE.gb/GECG01016617.1/~~gb/GECG01016617.1/.p1  ORF type:complete len:266 (+),score=27.05 gb/GECG01016617.1/:1-798(+)